MRRSPASRPAVFLDRDGTLIEDCGWLRDPAEVKFYPQTIPALLALAPHFALFIITHQRGIADGLLTNEEVERVNTHIVETLRNAGISIEDVYCCPHKRDQACQCIKPKPFFLQKAARDHGIDLARSFVIGDHPHDVQLAHNAGARGIYVLTGHGTKHRQELAEPCTIAADIAEAAAQILFSLTNRQPPSTTPHQQSKTTPTTKE
ncbi:MAG: HAD family hydrolase [Verrucomicrobiae bacterium]|nr:HAD family hydrolase [Verrucomicrobiae bacterium]